MTAAASRAAAPTSGQASPAPTRHGASRARLRPSTALGIGIVAIAAGTALWWLSPDDDAPYRYVTEATLSAERAQALAPITERGIALEQGSVVVSDSGEAAAEFVVARSERGQVLLDWRAGVDEPFLTLLPQPDELVALADTLRRHLPADGVVLAWWDTSRALALLAGIPAVFERHLGEPLIVPPRWEAQRASVTAIEQRFFAAADAEAAIDAERRRFRLFADALLSDEASGIARLHELAGERPAVLVLHVRDALLLGALDPDRIGVAFRDLPAQGPSHAAIRNVREWMSSNDFEAYTLLHREGQPLRAVALTDEASGETLAARLLPFIGNRQADVAGATLVYRSGGFVVFELDTRSISDAASSGARSFASLSK